MCAQMWLLFVVLQVAAKIGKKLACGLRAADFARFERRVVVVEKSRKTGHVGPQFDCCWTQPYTGHLLRLFARVQGDI